MNALTDYFVTSRPLKYWMYFSLIIWTLAALVVFLTGLNSLAILGLYLLYVVITAVYISVSRGDLFSPPIMIAIISFVAIGSPMPFLQRGEFLEQTYSSNMLLRCFGVFLLGYFAFLLGYVSRFLGALLPVGLLTNTKNATRNPSVLFGLFLGIYLLTSLIVRRSLHIGVAGEEPTIRGAGIIQYIFLMGTQVFISWYFLSSMFHRLPVSRALAVGLFAGFAVVQALLGWRSGIITVIILAASLYWYSKRIYLTKISLIWIIILLLVGVSVINLGNITRMGRLGGEDIETISQKIDKAWLRFWITPKLSPILGFFPDTSLTNHLLIIPLFRQGITAEQYNNKIILGNPIWQIHGNASTGFGTMYIYLGLVGVFAGYLILGALSRALYQNIFRSQTAGQSFLAVILYCMFIPLLWNSVTENLDTWGIKYFIALSFFILILRLLSRGASAADEEIDNFQQEEQFAAGDTMYESNLR